MTVENALGFLTDTVSFRCSVVVGEYMKKAWIGSLLFPFFFSCTRYYFIFIIKYEINLYLKSKQ